MPPIVEQTVDVPLSVLQQGIPKTSGLLGTLKRLIDSQVVRFQSLKGGAPQIRAEKREAFATLSDTVRSVTDGSVQLGAELDSQTLLTSFGDQVVLATNDKLHVYSNTTAAWEQHDYQLPVDVLTQDYVHTSNTLATTPDLAHAQGVSCYVWVNGADHDPGGGAPSEEAGCYFRVVDAAGVTLRQATRLDPTSRRVKVVSDGAYFWIFCEKGDGTGNVQVRIVSRYGVDLASTSFACTYAAPGFWDITSTSFGVAFAQANPGGGGVQLSKFSYDGVTTITRTSNTDATITGFQGLAWLTNDVDGYGYLATVEHVGPDDNSIHAYRITSGLVQDNHYAVATGQLDQIGSVTGYVVPGSLSDLVVAFSILDDTTPTPSTLSNVVREYNAPFGGAATFFKTFRSMNLASRAFAIRGRYYYVGYYPSKLVTPAYNVELPNQPTYFLCPFGTLTQNVAGRFEYGIAYADWQTPGSNYNFALSSCVVRFPSGMRTALSYRAQSFTSSRIQVNGDVGYRVNTQATTVGVKAFTFGSDYGKAVGYGTDLLLPGPGATSWSGGAFSESNVNLAFEPPVAAVGPSGGGGLREGAYSIVVVGEWTDQNGNRVRSRPSVPLTVNVVGSGNYIALTGRMMHATNKRDLLIAVYCTDMVPDSGGGYVQTTLRYKVTVDAPTATAAPLYNDDDQSTWQFDLLANGITGNEILYTDKGQIENYPAPAFHRGAVWKDRVFVVAYDNSIWFSSQPTEGDALWFHPAFRVVLPTNDRITSIATMDDYLLVLCASSLWYVPLAGALPDSSGSGNVPTAVPLPFRQGCTGQAEVTRDGCVYSSTAGGLWLITRALENVWLGEAAADALTGTVSALAVDAKQRVYAVVGSALVVYDSIVKTFYEWSTPNPVQLLGTWMGAPMYGDGSLVWRELAGNYVDTQVVNGVQTLAPYNQAVELNSLHFGNVRNFASLLEIQAIGETFTPCTVTMALKYDDNDEVIESTSWETDMSTPFEYSYGPANQLCSAVGITLTESVGAGQASGRGFAVELLSLTVGLYRGQNRLPDSRRV